MTFLKAVNSTSSIRDHLKSGLKALRSSDRNRISCDGLRLPGSVDIDTALRDLHPNDARWDYAVGVANPRQPDSAAWLEVHPASSLHVDEVLAKLRWLKQWLESGAPELDQLPRRFCWIATGAVSFDRGSRQAKRMAQAGLRFPVKHVDLERVFAD